MPQECNCLAQVHFEAEVIEGLKEAEGRLEHHDARLYPAYSKTIKRQGTVGSKDGGSYVILS